MIQPVYFFYFLSVGVSMPFFPPYLRGLGLTGHQIATVLALVPVLNMGMPLFWAWTADRTRRHARVLSGLCLGAFCGYAPMIFVRDYRGVLLAYLGFSLFSVGIGSLIDSIGISRARQGESYGRIRVWGSVGYIVSAVGVGAVLTWRGSRAPEPLVPVLLTTALFGTFLSTLQLKGAGDPGARPHWRDIGTLLTNPRFRMLLVLAPLHWIGCAPYNIFFGIFVQDRRMTPLALGLALATGVVAEMLFLLWFARLRRWFRIETLLAITFAVTALRWMAMPFASSLPIVVLLQLLHGLTFGLFWGSGIALVGECVPPPLRATGQSIYVMSMLGIGNVVGYLTTGWIYDLSGHVDPAFFAAAVLELAPLVLVLLARRRNHQAPGLVRASP